MTLWSHLPRVRPRAALVASVALAGVTTAALLLSVTSPVAPTAEVPPPASRAALPEHLSGSYVLALEDGSVVEVGADGRPIREILVGWDRRASDDAIPLALGPREVSYDPVTNLLWYSDSHLTIRSLDLSSGARGPEIAGFADTAVPGCGVANAARHIAVDVVGRRLVVPALTGAILLYDLDTAKLVDVVDPRHFGNDFVIYGFRHYVTDPVSGAAWYATSTGELVEVQRDLRTPSGRVIDLAAQDRPAPDAQREMFIDPSGRLLVYQTADGRLASIDLHTLQPAGFVAAFEGIARAGSIEYLAN